jgi:hypothetical protein
MGLLHDSLRAGYLQHTIFSQSVDKIYAYRSFKYVKQKPGFNPAGDLIFVNETELAGVIMFAPELTLRRKGASKP